MTGRIRETLGERLRVAEGRLLIRSGKVDLGQRISTALARIAAEELGLPLERIDVAPVTAGDSPDEGITSGSNSVEQSGGATRAAAATLRRRALALAAERLGVAEAALALRDGLVIERGSNRTLDLLALAAEIPPEAPVDPDAPPLSPPLTPPPAPPRGLAEMVRGAFRYVHDLRAPGMLHARVVRPPHAEARLRRLDAAAASALEAEGVRIVRDGGFLAVAAPREWDALRAAARLARACDWDGRGGLEAGDPHALLAGKPRLSLPVVDGRPVEAPVPPPLEAPTLEATFHRPYTLHGALAPSAALAEWDGGRLRVTCHSQGVHALRETMAEALGLALDAVEARHAPGSGCYGHNGADDAAFEAALVARALPATPVLLTWTREEEHAWAPCGPAASVHVAARLEDGRIAAWSAEHVSGTHRGRPRPGPDRAGPRRLLASRFRAEPLPPWTGEPNMNRHGGMHRNLDPIYAVGERRLVKSLASGMPLRTSALRTLGAALNALAIESVMDELAERVGESPLAFRLAHLPDPEDRAPLEALAEAAGLDRPAPEGFGRGIGYARYKNAQARVAAAVELTVDDAAVIRLRRAVLVCDAGRVVDPDGIRAQLEGGFLQALGWALRERVAWDRDGPLTRDWESYPVLRFGDVPEIETVLLDRPERPSLGAGEAACGPALGAVANALHAATGLRLRRLPFDPEAVREAAYAA